MSENKKAIILLSGGLDSTTVLAIAKNQGYNPYALSFRYGQRHLIELDAARNVAAAFGPMQHVIADIDLRLFGGSALTADIDVPKRKSKSKTSDSIDTPVSYTHLTLPTIYPV